MIRNDCYATLGVVGNSAHMNISLGTAGRTRWLGVRPQTLGRAGRSRCLALRPQTPGRAMIPIVRPNGGGEARGKWVGGRQHPEWPGGNFAKGLKPRRKKKPSNQYIVRGRKAKK